MLIIITKTELSETDGLLLSHASCVVLQGDGVYLPLYRDFSALSQVFQLQQDCDVRGVECTLPPLSMNQLATLTDEHQQWLTI